MKREREMLTKSASNILWCIFCLNHYHVFLTSEKKQKTKQMLFYSNPINFFNRLQRAEESYFMRYPFSQLPKPTDCSFAKCCTVSTMATRLRHLTIAQETLVQSQHFQFRHWVQGEFFFSFFFTFIHKPPTDYFSRFKKKKCPLYIEQA